MWKVPAALSKSAAGLALANSDVAGKINNCIVLFFLMMKRGHHLSVRHTVNSKSERNFGDVASPGTDRTEADSGAEVPSCGLRYSLWTARRRPPSPREGALPGPRSPPRQFSLLTPSQDPGSSP